MNDIPDTVRKTLDVLSARFSATGEMLWHAVVNYCFVYALTWMICGVAASLTMIVICYHCEIDPHGFDADLGHFFRIAGIIIGIIGTAAFIAANFADVAIPEAAALRMILHG